MQSYLFAFSTGKNCLGYEEKKFTKKNKEMMYGIYLPTKVSMRLRVLHYSTHFSIFNKKKYIFIIIFYFVINQYLNF